MSTEKYVLVKKKSYEWTKMGLKKPVWNEEPVYGVETHRLFGKEYVPGSAVSEGHVDSLLKNKRTHDYWFPWKSCNWKQWFLLPTPWAKITLFIELLTHYIHMLPQLKKKEKKKESDNKGKKNTKTTAVWSTKPSSDDASLVRSSFEANLHYPYDKKTKM